MKFWLTLLPLLLLSQALPVQAAGQCAIEPVKSNAQGTGPWIDRENWLAPENLRIGLQSAGAFMPLLKMTGPVSAELLRPAARQLQLDKIKASDPFDQQTRDIGFLLDTRLYADGVVVLRNGKVWIEQYWHGLSAQQPRLLLGGSRPLLSLMGVLAVAQGKLWPDRSIIRHVPALSAQTGLRKLSLQRLLEANSRFNWSAQEIDDWQTTSGWRSGRTSGDVRSWLNRPDRWERDFADDTQNTVDIEPDADLLTWALSESYRVPLAQVFCDNLLVKLRPEHPVLWLTDAQGTELAGGLALSLRDFARIGQMLIEARNSGSRSKIPKWFIETLNASAGLRKTGSSALAGLKKGSEYRYGFVHLGGAPNRIAVLGPYGNSLYVDFDRRLVIALFASYPRDRSAGMLATLEQVWEKLASATQPAGKR